MKTNTTNKLVRSISLPLSALAVLGLASCATPSQSGTLAGAGVGGAAGAVTGGIIGKQLGHTTTGAVLGGVVGAGVGSAIGHEKGRGVERDQQISEQERRIRELERERYGYGPTYSPPRY